MLTADEGTSVDGLSLEIAAGASGRRLGELWPGLVDLMDMLSSSSWRTMDCLTTAATDCRRESMTLRGESRSSEASRPLPTNLAPWICSRSSVHQPDPTVGQPAGQYFADS